MDKEFPVHHMTIENIVKFIATPQNWVDVIGPKGYVLKNENMKDGKIESFDLFVANKNGLFDVDIHFKKMYITENSFQYDTMASVKKRFKNNDSIFFFLRINIKVKLMPQTNNGDGR